LLGCRSVGTGGLYDVYFVAPQSSVASDVWLTVRFVGGRYHNASTSVALASMPREGLSLSNTTVVRDIPSVRGVALYPSSGVLKAGDVLSVVVDMWWGEEGLAPVPGGCCVVNGVNVTESFEDVGGGQYRLSYRIGPGDDDVFQGTPSMVLAFADSRYVIACIVGCWGWVGAAGSCACLLVWVWAVRVSTFCHSMSCAC
jgi:hypothetical protein